MDNDWRRSCFSSSNGAHSAATSSRRSLRPLDLVRNINWWEGEDRNGCPHEMCFFYSVQSSIEHDMRLQYSCLIIITIPYVAFVFTILMSFPLKVMWRSKDKSHWIFCSGTTSRNGEQNMPGKHILYIICIHTSIYIYISNCYLENVLFPSTAKINNQQVYYWDLTSSALNAVSLEGLPVGTDMA